VSFATASYGAWPFDLVVLLLPVIQMALSAIGAHGRGVARASSVAWVLLNGLALALNLLHFESLWFVWMTPALLVCYYFLQRSAIPAAHAEAPSLVNACLVAESANHA
jgi:hypothetical protein